MKAKENKTKQMKLNFRKVRDDGNDGIKQFFIGCSWYKIYIDDVW